MSAFVQALRVAAAKRVNGGVVIRYAYLPLLPKRKVGAAPGYLDQPQKYSPGAEDLDAVAAGCIDVTCVVALNRQGSASHGEGENTLVGNKRLPSSLYDIVRIYRGRPTRESFSLVRLGQRAQEAAYRLGPMSPSPPAMPTSVT